MASAGVSYCNVHMKIQEFIDQICSFQAITPQMKLDIFQEIFDYSWSRRAYASCPMGFSGYPSGLYEYIQKCLQNKMQQLNETIDIMQDEEKLRLYRKYYEQYKDMSHILYNACCYIERHAPRDESIYVDGTEPIPPMRKTFEQIWKEFFFQPLLSRIARACLNLIKIHRNNHSAVDVNLIKDTIEIYTANRFEFKSKSILNADSTTDIYKKYLENELLRDAKDFYCQQTVPIFELNSVNVYILAIIVKWNEITIFHKIYLPSDAIQVLLETLEEIFVPDSQLVIISNEFKTFLLAENYREFANYYFTTSGILRIKNTCLKLMETHIYEAGCKLLSDIKTDGANDSKRYIEMICQTRIKCKSIIRDYFNDNSDVLPILDNVSRRLVNDYSIIGTDDNRITPSLLIARYCDVYLRKGNSLVQDVDFADKIDQMMILFDYLEDKDLFIRFYEKMFVKRLINRISSSHDNEESIITRLTEVCGSTATSQLRQISRDASVSETLIQQYKNINPKNQIDFSAIVFGSNKWPLSKQSDFVLPFELTTTFDSFKNFYTQQHTGRCLIWLHQYSNVEMQTLFAGCRYLLQVSMYQMAVLLLFNKSHRWTVEEIEEETKIQRDLLISTVSSLLRSRLLTSPRMTEDLAEIDIDSNDKIEISTDFQNDKVLIDLHSLAKSTKQNGWKKLHQSVDDDRHMLIQATIIRIMKSERKLKHTLLIQQVIDQLKSRFKPQISLIKKSIDILIEKEYLQRQSSDKDTLEYLA